MLPSSGEDRNLTLVSRWQVQVKKYLQGAKDEKAKPSAPSAAEIQDTRDRAAAAMEEMAVALGAMRVSLGALLEGQRSQTKVLRQMALTQDTMEARAGLAWEERGPREAAVAKALGVISEKVSSLEGAYAMVHDLDTGEEMDGDEDAIMGDGGDDFVME
jgi:hypothetical protein